MTLSMTGCSIKNGIFGKPIVNNGNNSSKIRLLLGDALMLKLYVFEALSAENNETLSPRDYEKLKNLKVQFEEIEALRDESKIDIKKLWESIINNDLNTFHAYGYAR